MGKLPRRCFANCKRAAEIYPAVTLCLIDVYDLSAAGSTGAGCVAELNEVSGDEFYLVEISR
jgi:hypothetical protein